MRSLFYSILIIAFVCTGVLAQPELDPTFGSGGKAVINSAGLSGAQDMAIQPDNKIILVSSCNHISLGRMPFCAVRVNENGSFDGTFTTDNPGGAVGVFTMFDNSRNGAANGVALQNDGKVIVVGWAPGKGPEDAALVRYNPNGSYDLSFGSGGKVLTDVTTAGNDRAERL